MLKKTTPPCIPSVPFLLLHPSNAICTLFQIERSQEHKSSTSTSSSSASAPLAPPAPRALLPGQIPRKAVPGQIPRKAGTPATPATPAAPAKGAPKQSARGPVLSGLVGRRKMGVAAAAAAEEEEEGERDREIRTGQLTPFSATNLE
jgi:hypothetical protein